MIMGQLQFKVGDLVVWYHAPLARVKLAKNWDGPFPINELVFETRVIMKGKDGKYRKSNVRRLKPYTEQMS